MGNCLNLCQHCPCPCPCGDSEGNRESQSLLHGHPQVRPESARPSRPAPKYAEQKICKFTARHVGVPDLDGRFRDVADTFNQQYENYETMVEHLSSLSYRYHCSNKLSECLRKIGEEHDAHHISLQMKGYDFSLVVTPADDMPNKLQRTQESISSLCQAAKAVVSRGTKLQEMINWLLKAEERLIEQVGQAALSYQEQQRLGDNLRENLREVRRAKELSPDYREEAGKLLNEAALLSGVTP